ncbi:MAG: CDP-diacylglycerol--serine O-phosphatidyltransferase [Methanophagales archaeon]|nr:CDP-diacylglycerol--serine O-phosphatidyltransferase [Methanophagales archaeon]MCW7073363.1 CDP-diacylglycerol--serine O-phosphatidyltransferase [Methanophagales archaeon]
MQNDDLNINILKLIKLPDLISICNALLGFLAILLVLSGGSEALKDALVVILSAAVIDGLDGLVARRIESSHMGRYLDSLADMVSFGTAPAILAFVLINDRLMTVVCSAYLICGELRLARFDARAAEATTGDMDVDFEGLPITGSAVVLASFMLLALELHLHLVSSLFLNFLMAALCILMTSRIRYRNLRDMRIVIPLGCIFFALILFYALHSPLFIYPTAIITALAAFYICSPAATYLKEMRSSLTEIPSEHEK